MFALNLLDTSKGHRKQDGDRSECAAHFNSYLLALQRKWNHEPGRLIGNDISNYTITQTVGGGLNVGLSAFFSHFLQISLELQENSASTASPKN